MFVRIDFIFAAVFLAGFVVGVTVCMLAAPRNRGTE